MRIPRDSEALYLLQQVRDEAHRFAITYHRKLRDKKMTRSVLDDVPGLGPTRRKRLLKEFGSVKRLREQPVETFLELTVAARTGRARPLRAPARRRCRAVVVGRPGGLPSLESLMTARRPSPALDVTVITGMSGAGRSEAADVLEDLGFFVIDNLPPALIGKVAELARGGDRPHALRPRGRRPLRRRSSSDLSAALADLRASGAHTRVLFLDASDDDARAPVRGDPAPPPARGHRPRPRRHPEGAGAARAS